jgi:hypothetical protein
LRRASQPINVASRKASLTDALTVVIISRYMGYHDQVGQKESASLAVARACRIDNKVAKKAFHVCARVKMAATKSNPEQDTRSGSYAVASTSTLSGRRRGVGGWEMPSGRAY